MKSSLFIRLNSHRFISRIITALLSAGLIGVGFLTAIPQTAQAATGINQTINYQGRLLTATGAVVPDGNYNMTFKIYQDGAGAVAGDTGGTLEWTEVDQNTIASGSTAPVVVKNGYFSVTLGSLCPLSGSTCQGNTNTGVNFNSDTLWLSTNIAGTAVSNTPTYDGEMLPMKRLAANPYAINSGQLGGLTSGQYVQLGQGIQAATSTTNAAIAINQTGATANILDLQRGGADVQLINNAGQTLFRPTTDSQTALQVQKAGTTTVVFTVDSTNSRIGIGTGAPAYAVDAVGSVNASVSLKVAGTDVCTSSGCVASLTSAIRNSATQQTSATFSIDGSGTAANFYVLPGGNIDTSSGGALNIGSALASSINIGPASGSQVIYARSPLYLTNNVATSLNSRVQLQGTFSSSYTGAQYGSFNQLDFNPTGASVGSINGQTNLAEINGSSLNVAGLTGSAVGVSTTSGYTGLVGSASGLSVSSPTIGGLQLFTAYQGVYIQNNTANGGNTSGTITNTQLKVGGTSAAAGTGGTVTNYGVYLAQPAGSGGTTNNYGLYINGNGGGTTNYSLYNNSTAASYFAGNLTSATTIAANAFTQNGNSVCDASGNCSAAGGYIINGTGAQSGANFNIGGSGTVGTTLSVGGQTVFNGSGLLQSAALSGTYSNALTLSNNTNVYSGASSTVSGTAAAQTLSATTNTLTPSLDTASGVALNIGQTTATSINIGKTASNVATTINGTAVIKPTSGNDSSTAFQLQNAESNTVLTENTAPDTNNLITNPGFELAGTSAWVAKGGAALSRQTTQPYSGQASMRVITTATIGDGVKYPYVLAANTNYEFAVDVYGTTALAGITVGYSSDGSTESTYFATAACVANNWCRFELPVNTPATVNAGAYFFIKQTDAVAHTMYIDDAFAGLNTLVASADGINVLGSYSDARLNIGGSSNSTITNVGIGTTNSQAALEIDQQHGQLGLFLKGSGEGFNGNPFDSGPLFEVMNQSGTTAINYAEVLSETTIQGGSAFLGTAAEHVNTLDSGATALRVSGASGQTADVLQVTNFGNTVRYFSVNGSGGVTLGTTSAATGQLTFANSSNSFTSLIQGNTSATASYTSILPAAVGAAGKCLSIASVASTTQTFGYATCAGGGGGVTLQGSSPGTPDTGNFNISGTGIAGTELDTLDLDTPSATTLTIGGTATALSILAPTTVSNSLAINVTSSATAFTINGGTALLTADTTASRLTFGAVGGCITLQGKVCINQSAQSGSANVVNLSNVLTIGTVTSGGASYGQRLIVNDTSSQVVTDNGLYINNTGTTNSTATVNGIYVDNPTGLAGGNLIELQAGSNDVLNVSNAGIVTVGDTSSLTGQLAFANATNNNTSTITGNTSTSASYTSILPSAVGIAGKCLAVASVASTIQTLGYATCSGGGGGVSLQTGTLTPDTGSLDVSGSGVFGTAVQVGSNGTSTSQLYVSGTLPTFLGQNSDSNVGNPRSLAVVGRYAYVASYTTSKLVVYDISSGTPVYIGQNSDSNLNNPQSVTIAGRYAYVASYTSGKLVVYDISSGIPVFVGLNSDSNLSNPQYVAVEGRYAIVASNGNSKLMAYDISSGTPVYVGQNSDSNLNSPSAVAVEGHYAFVASGGSSKLVAYDISSGTPVFVGLNSDANLSGPLGVTVVGRYAYVASNGNSKLLVYDVSYGTPVYVGVNSDSNLSNPHYVAVSGRYAYVVNTGGKLAVYDISSGTPVYVGQNSDSNLSGAQFVAVVGRYAYVANTTAGKVDTYDLGGGYTQQFEAGSAEIGNLSVNNNASFNGNLSVGSGVEVGGGLVVNGDIGVNGNLQLGNSSTFAETTTCGTSAVNGALYYNSKTGAIRGCVNSNWEDIVTTAGLGIILYGVVPDSGSTNPGDLSAAGAAATGASGPCKVTVSGTASIITWTSCTAYSAGRKVLINSGTATISASTSVYQNLCIFVAGNQPTLGTASATETSAQLPTFSPGSPALCLATILTATAASKVAAIYDTRVFTTDVKVFGAIGATGLGTVVKVNTTAGTFVQAGAAAAAFGVVGMWSGTASTTTPNAVIITGGPMWVRSNTTAGTIGNYLNTAALGVVSNTTASATAYVNVGIAATVYSGVAAGCAVSVPCSGSDFTNIDIK